MWFVVKLFTDLQDGDHVYSEGDPFPREGKEVSEERIKELSSSNNRQGMPLIEEEREEVENTEAKNEVKKKRRGRPKKE